VPDPKHAADRPATFGEVFADREFRAIFSASALSWCGDYLAKAAVTALVYRLSGSVALSAASFAVSYLPGLTAGPVLAALAERYPNRSVMVICDLLRACLISLVALPNMPVPAMLLLLFTTALLNPPFDASRSALTPRILTGDRYVVGLSAQRTANSMAQVTGYLAGGALAPYHPRLALLIDAVTFLISACFVRFGLRLRSVLGERPHDRHLLRETAAAFRLVWTNPVLRAIAVVVLGSALFVVVPEGLGAAWAATLSHTHAGQGVDQAMIMMAGPTGAAIGALVISRLVTPHRRHTLIRPLAVVVPGALVPTLLIHSAAVVTGLVVVSGFAAGGLITSTNHLFVSALPAPFRARAFGVMQFGLQLTQAVALVATGLLADHIDLPTVVGSWSLAGAAGMVVVGMAWPSAAVVDKTVAEVRAQNERTESVAHDPGLVMPAPEEAVGIPQNQGPVSANGREPAGGGHGPSGVRNRRAARAADRAAPRQDLPDHDLSRGEPARRPVA
jgi:MFS family permease